MTILKKSTLKSSKYNSTENTKVTYLLGAGASFNSIPIWDGQGDSMIDVADYIEYYITNQVHANKNNDYLILKDNQEIKNLVLSLRNYGKKAQEFGTLDIYARNLYLLNKVDELNDLKFNLSVYFDIWENINPPKIKHFSSGIKESKYDKIDKRYFSLLAVILEKSESNPIINNNIKFLSWNYDLQLEMAYKSFMNNPDSKSINEINKYFNFYGDNNDKNIIHLNGFRGAFEYEKSLYPIVDKYNFKDIGDYLVSFLNHKKGFISRAIDYQETIKYAWEENSKTLESAKKILSQTDILVIIGYSFPSYNRKIDSQLLDAFEELSKSNIKRIIYQNPNKNIELIESITNVEVEHFEGISQFYIPQEFLFPKPPSEPFFG